MRKLEVIKKPKQSPQHESSKISYFGEKLLYSHTIGFDWKFIELDNTHNFQIWETSSDRLPIDDNTHVFPTFWSEEILHVSPYICLNLLSKKQKALPAVVFAAMLANYFGNNEISKQESLKKNGIKQFWYQDYKSLTTKVILDMECQEYTVLMNVFYVSLLDII